MISVNGGAVNVAAGSSPNAATTPDFVLADGALFPIEALTDGVLIAVADA